MRSGFFELFIVGLLGLALSVVGAICYGRAVGVVAFYDAVAPMGLYSGLLVSLFVLFGEGCCFVMMVIRWKFRGFGYCVAGGFVALLAIGFVMPTMGRISPESFREECAEHMEEIGESLIAYSNGHDGVLPEIAWCDVLMLEQKVDARSFCCRGRHAIFIEGESSFVMNEQVAGGVLTELAGDVVLLFETKYRGFESDRLDYELAWNQTGGIDQVTFGRHGGLGCNILFADGHVEFVRKKEVSGLRWKP